MRPDREPAFIERRTYRRRRMTDAARLMPFLGAILICLPVLWTVSGTREVSTAYAMGYLFLIWLLLAVLAAGLAYVLQPDDSESDEDSGSAPGPDMTGPDVDQDAEATPIADKGRQ